MRSLLLLLCVVVAPLSARAQDFVGTRAMSLGEAYRAIATGNDAIYFNPAGIGQVPRYSPEVHYNFNLIDEAQQFDASVVDSKTSAFAAGLAYTFQGAQFTRRAVFQHAATLAMAYSIFPRIFDVGLGLKYVNVTDAFVGNYLNALTADLGFLVHIPGGVNVGVVGYNLIPFQSSHVPISAAIGAAWDLGPLSAALFGGIPAIGAFQNAAGTLVPGDMSTLRGPLSDLTLSSDLFVDFLNVRGPQGRISAGLEYLAFQMVPLRAGYMYDSDAYAGGGSATHFDDHYATVGAGFIIPYFGFDVGYKQALYGIIDDPLGTSRTFTISVKFFVDMPTS